MVLYQSSCREHILSKKIMPFARANAGVITLAYLRQDRKCHLKSPCSMYYLSDGDGSRTQDRTRSTG